MHGRGINIQDGATLTGARVVVEDVHEIGISALGPASRVAITDLFLGPVNPAECGSTTCVAAPAGYGLGAYRATISVAGFEIADADLCGIHVAESGRVEAQTGIVHGSQIGACLQSDAQDVDSLSGVRFFDNGLSLDTTTLPVPGVLGAD
jgi:hypothetical protein